MIGLGVLGNQPANPYQPALTNGIHLRWGFRRELGFPWHGFYLYRRPALPGRPVCLSSVTGGLKKGSWPEKKYRTALGVITSDTNLVMTEDFAPGNRVEFALDGRSFLRCDFPAGELARRVELLIGFRGKGCLDYQKLIPPPVPPATSVTQPNPLNLQGASFTVKDSDGKPLKNTQFDLLNTASGPLLGLGCAYGLTITLSATVNSIELLMTVNVITATIEAFDRKGAKVATVTLKNPMGGNQPEIVQLIGQNITRVEVRTSRNSAYLHRICADIFAEHRETQGGSIKVTAFAGGAPVRSASVDYQAGKTVSVALEADAIDAIELGPSQASLIDLCYVPVAQDATQGWERVPQFSYPLGLPVSEPSYPCSVAAPQSLVTDRVRYPLPPEWDGTTFTELHDQLVKLVHGGPSATPMVQRIFSASLDASTPDLNPPQLSKFYLLDMILLGALHPALAQLVGLYWVDQIPAAIASGQAFDYLIVADHTGVGQRNADKVLAVIKSAGFAQLDGYIVFNKRAVAAPPLPIPVGLQTFELPGGTFPNAQGQLPQASNNAGLRWEVGDEEADDLPPENAVMYLVWRADLGDDATPAPAGVHDLVTKAPPDKPKPLLVTEARLPNGLEPQRSPEWPKVPFFIDRNLPDGWYSYQISGIDLFGRHSPNSASSPVRLQDKIPPPMPTGVEAYALDTADPYLQRDDAYQAWFTSLDPVARQTLIGLRVRWIWTTAHQQQAPDTVEFRIYFHPGAAPPADRDQSLNWQERFYVVGYDDNVKVNSVSGERAYEIFLPPPTASSLTSLPLNPTLADPVVYAHVGVSAADDKPHTNDQRTTGNWSNRLGNEGHVGPPAKVYRVWRTLPPPPEDVLKGERFYASPADYHSRSFFTYRWKPQPSLQLHVFRAMDDAVFKADWSQRPPANPLDESQLEFFPAGWNQATRQAVVAELYYLNSFVGLSDGAAQAMAYYRQLSDAALRVLAGLPTSESAFVQLTIKPLDPNAAANQNRLGPDNPDDLILDATERAFIDTLDGCSTNRYFYRAASVDAAHNLGPLGLASPPVYLPNVVAPRAPVITKVLGGDRQITIQWASNREPDLAEYRVYRTDNEQATRDLRLMTLVHTEPVPSGDPATRPAEVFWTDMTVPGLTTFIYRLVAVDDAGNASTPSLAGTARAFDDSRPDPPTWNPPSVGVQPDEVLLSWVSPLADLACLVQRSVTAADDWQNLSVWLPRGTYTFVDGQRQVGVSYDYRLRVMDAGGHTNRQFVVITL